MTWSTELQIWQIKVERYPALSNSVVAVTSKRDIELPYGKKPGSHIEQNFLEKYIFHQRLGPQLKVHGIADLNLELLSMAMLREGRGGSRVKIQVSGFDILLAVKCTWTFNTS